MESIEDILEQARRGDARALSTLYTRFLPGIFGYVALRVPDRAAAEDVTSEVFLQMVENIHRLKARDEPGFAAWLLRIARVTVAGYYRKRERQPVLVPLPVESWEETRGASPVIASSSGPGDPVAWMETQEAWQEVVQAINTLTEEQRQVLVGRLILGYDLASIAQMIGKKVNAVKALQFRALKSLQRLLGMQADTSTCGKRQQERIR